MLLKLEFQKLDKFNIMFCKKYTLVNIRRDLKG